MEARLAPRRLEWWRMSLKIIRGKTLPIGLDVGSSNVKMAQLRCGDGEVELLAAEWAAFAPDCRTDRRNSTSPRAR